MLGDATVDCVDDDNDDDGDGDTRGGVLVGSRGRSALLLRLMRLLAAVRSWYERNGSICVTVVSVCKLGTNTLSPTFHGT